MIVSFIHSLEFAPYYRGWGSYIAFAIKVVINCYNSMELENQSLSIRALIQISKTKGGKPLMP